MWLSHPFSLRIRYVVVVAFSACIAFNSAAQAGVVRIPRAPASVILNVPIRTGWNAEFHCNHDDRELICVIANLKHGKEERYPELLIDPQNREARIGSAGNGGSIRRTTRVKEMANSTSTSAIGPCSARRRSRVGEPITFRSVVTM
jgi:hypothetical protein